jgi:hypothetical protein
VSVEGQRVEEQVGWEKRFRLGGRVYLCQCRGGYQRTPTG